VSPASGGARLLCVPTLESDVFCVGDAARLRTLLLVVVINLLFLYFLIPSVSSLRSVLNSYDILWHPYS
jgi:hypothetical protein